MNAAHIALVQVMALVSFPDHFSPHRENCVVKKWSWNETPSLDACKLGITVFNDKSNGIEKFIATPTRETNSKDG